MSGAFLRRAILAGLILCLLLGAAGCGRKARPEPLWSVLHGCAAAARPLR